LRVDDAVLGGRASRPSQRDVDLPDALRMVVVAEAGAEPLADSCAGPEQGFDRQPVAVAARLLALVERVSGRDQPGRLPAMSTGRSPSATCRGAPPANGDVAIQPCSTSRREPSIHTFVTPTAARRCPARALSINERTQVTMRSPGVARSRMNSALARRTPAVCAGVRAEEGVPPRTLESRVFTPAGDPESLYISHRMRNAVDRALRNDC